jgi:ABC-type lipopolysaccharide export system ATPase subunit
MLQEYPKVIILLDALDECDINDRSDIARHLPELGTSGIGFLLTSHPEIRDTFGALVNSDHN